MTSVARLYMSRSCSRERSRHVEHERRPARHRDAPYLRTHAHPVEMDHPHGDHPAGPRGAACRGRVRPFDDDPAPHVGCAGDGTRRRCPTDAAAIAEGGRLARILGCHDCHGEHLEGRLFFSEPHVADLVAPNLSRLVPSYSDAELARAIRHGIRRDGTGLFAMPSASFFHLSDEDLGRLIAYLRRQPRRDGDERVDIDRSDRACRRRHGPLPDRRRDHGPRRHAGRTGAVVEYAPRVASTSPASPAANATA